MKTRVSLPLFERIVAVCLAGSCLGAAGCAGAAPSRDSVTIIVFEDRYVTERRVFDDLNELEDRITSTNFRTVTLLVCGAHATRALKAAVHRFRYVPVQMRVPDVDERECMTTGPVVTKVRQRTGTRPFGIDDEAVDRYWHDIMP